MKFLDRIALNRLVSIILSFILSIIKIISPKTDNNPIIPLPKPPLKRRPWFPRGKND